jgi:hypothetical protein
MPWARAAVECAARGGTVMFLPKLDTSTEWWALLMSVASDVVLFKDRLQFKGGPMATNRTSNNFCSALFVLANDLHSPTYMQASAAIARLQSTGRTWPTWRPNQ